MLNIVSLGVKEELRQIIKKATLFESNGEINYQQRVMPSMYSYLSYNSCSMPIFISNNVKQQPKERLQFIGPKTNTNIEVLHKGKIEQLMFEFSAYGFYSLFNKSPKNYCNKLNNYSIINSACNLENYLKNSKNKYHRAERIQEHLISLSKKQKKVDLRIVKAVSFIEEKKGIIKVQDICEEVNMGERNLNRLFNEIIGISPQVFSKIIQLHSIISIFADQKSNQKLNVAYLSGFYDQSHFNRTFKKLVNLTPSQFLRSSEHISLEYFAKNSRQTN